MKSKGGKGKWFLSVRLLFLALSVWLLIHVVDFKTVFRHVGDIPLFVLVPLVLLGIFRVWLSGVRWRMVNPDVSGQLDGWGYFRLMMMAKPFNLVMPGALGGDFVKTAFTLRAVKTRRVDNIIAIIVDYYLGLLSITVLGSCALLFMSDIPDKRPFYLFFSGLAGFFALSYLAAGNPWFLKLLADGFSRMGSMGARLGHVLKTWKSAHLFFRSNRTRLMMAMLLCLPIHGVSFISTYILSVYLGMGISFFDVCLVLALVWVITAVPITISGAGVRELSLIYFLSLYGVGSEAATALSVYLYIVRVALGIIGVGFLMFGNNLAYAEEGVG